MTQSSMASLARAGESEHRQVASDEFSMSSLYSALTQGLQEAHRVRASAQDSSLLVWAMSDPRGFATHDGGQMLSSCFKLSIFKISGDVSAFENDQTLSNFLFDMSGQSITTSLRPHHR